MRTERLELIKSILERAFREGREGSVLRIQEARRRGREIPEEHQKILRDVRLFGGVLPKNPFQGDMTIN